MIWKRVRLWTENAILSLFIFALLSGSIAHAENSANNEKLLNYQMYGQKQSFQRPLELLTLQKQEKLKQFLDSLYFIDFGHAALELMQMFTGKLSYQEARFPVLYDRDNSNAFQSFLAARHFLLHSKAKFNLSFVQKVHQIAVPWENATGHGPGTIRTRYVYGPEFENGLHPDQIQAIVENPYLHFAVGTGINADVLYGESEAKNGDLIRGAIIYPRAKDLKPEVIQRLQASHPQLAKKILSLQAKLQRNPNEVFEDFTQELVTALLEERIETFSQAQSKLGKIKTEIQLQNYISLIAQFQKDFVSIHPFPDGNGRTSRLLLGYLAEKKSLPVPRLVYPNEDILWTNTNWIQQVQQGMLATMFLEKDLENRIRSGKSLALSVALVSPVISEIPASQHEKFESYLQLQVHQDSNFTEILARDPVGTMRKIKIDFRSAYPICADLFAAK